MIYMYNFTACSILKKHHPHAEEYQSIDLILKSQTDVEFDIQKYHHQIPHG